MSAAPPRRVSALGAVLLAVGSMLSCGSDDRAVAPATCTSAIPSAVTATEPPPSGSTGSSTEPTTSTQPTTATSALATSFAPAAGVTLSVVGVAADAVLDVRSGPDATADVIATVCPHAEVTATGRARSGPGSEGDSASPASWWEIDTDTATDTATGWADRRHLAYRARTTDDTAEAAARTAGLPIAATLDELGRRALGPFDGAWVVVSGRTATTVTVDGTGAHDDSLSGFREHVVAEALPDGGFRLVSAQRTRFCSRGVTEDLRCV